MQKTKNKIRKTFVYQFESFFHIESSTNNIKLDFSDDKYIAKSVDFILNSTEGLIEIVYFNSHPSIVPTLHFDDKIKYKYLTTNTLISKTVLTDTSNDNLGVPIEETLMALEEAVQAGKIRYIGVSNETPWGVNEYLRLSDTKSVSKIQSIQNPYGLLNRTYEIGLAEITHNEKVGLLAYSPLGFGVLTGKYINTVPKDSRLGLYGDWFTRYNNDKCISATKRYLKLAEKNNLSLTQLALAFVNTRPFLTSNIIGATKISQLKENIQSIDIELSDEIIDEINIIHSDIPNPAP